MIKLPDPLGDTLDAVRLAFLNASGGEWMAQKCGEMFPTRWNIIALLGKDGCGRSQIRTIDQVLDYGGAMEAEANASLLAGCVNIMRYLIDTGAFDPTNNESAPNEIKMRAFQNLLSHTSPEMLRDMVNQDPEAFHSTLSFFTRPE